MIEDEFLITHCLTFLLITHAQLLEGLSTQKIISINNMLQATEDTAFIGSIFAHTSNDFCFTHTNLPFMSSANWYLDLITFLKPTSIAFSFMVFVVVISDLGFCFCFYFVHTKSSCKTQIMPQLTSHDTDFYQFDPSCLLIVLRIL